MKTQKKINVKKLSLSKETLVRLNPMQMTKIAGGYYTSRTGSEQITQCGCPNTSA
ncbi:MAG: class I lanthipeptide [Bacteroidota bacterium]